MSRRVTENPSSRNQERGDKPRPVPNVPPAKRRIGQVVDRIKPAFSTNVMANGAPSGQRPRKFAAAHVRRLPFASRVPSR